VQDNGWEIVERGEKTTTVECPRCGEETTVGTESAVLSGGVTCSNCGNAREISQPPFLAVIGLLIFGIIYAWLKPKVDWVVNRVR
jgi:predicted RNA-binding Zn-ribbon protein involved in translation (DUF1610 family)